MSIHSQNDQVILEFGLKKPAFRIVVNSPTTHGSIGLTTGLDPAMTLGCGGYGGNITSDNISPRHLLNIKRLAYELTPVANRFEAAGAPAGGPAPGAVGENGGTQSPRSTHWRRFRRRAQPPHRRLPRLARLSGRAGRSSPAWQRPPTDIPARTSTRRPRRDHSSVRRTSGWPSKPDKKLVLSERAIVTPAARDLGEQHRVFVVEPWRG